MHKQLGVAVGIEQVGEAGVVDDRTGEGEVGGWLWWQF